MSAPTSGRSGPGDHRFSTRGRRRTLISTTCAICGAAIQQAANGRPRLICSDASCVATRARRLRNARTPWRLAEFAEACAAWRGRCAFCACELGLVPSRFHAPPLPVCDLHGDPETQLRVPTERLKLVGYFIAEARRGYPLPRPFVKFSEVTDG